MRIATISTTGFKRGDVNEIFTPGEVRVYVGENESGKSGVLQATDLLFRGFVESDTAMAVPATNEGVLSFARDPEIGITVEAVIEEGDARHTVRRKWHRQSSGRNKQEITTDGMFDDSQVVRELANGLAGLLPDHRLWDVKEFMRASSSKLRHRLLMLCVFDTPPEKVCPPDVPDLLLPRPEEETLEWLPRAMAAAAERVQVLKKEIDEAQGDLEQYEDFWEQRAKPENGDDPKADWEYTQSRRYSLAKDAVRVARADLQKWKDWEGRLDQIGNLIIGMNEKRLSTALSQIWGRHVAWHATREDGIWLSTDGVDWRALSDGTVITLQAALQIWYSHVSDLHGFRLVRQDRLEAISAARRQRYLRMLVEALRAKKVDQVIVAGCPDTTPELDGVLVVRR